MSSSYIFGNLLLSKPVKTIEDKLYYLNWFAEPIKSTSSTKNEERLKILILSFDLNNKIFTTEKAEVPENIKKEDRLKLSGKYLWVGNTPDTTNRYLTTNNTNIERYYNPVLDGFRNPIYALLKSINGRDRHKALYDLLNQLVEIFYSLDNKLLNFNLFEKYANNISNIYEQIQEYNHSTSKTEQKKIKKAIKKELKFLVGSDEKFRKFIQVIHNEDDIKEQINNWINEIIDKINQIENVDEEEKRDPEYKKMKKETYNKIPKMLKEFYNSLLEINIKEYALITLKINGKLISEIDGYIDFLYEEKSSRQGQNEGYRVIGYCDLCHQQKEISADVLKKAWIKFFNTDKRFFSSNISNNFDNNFAVCDDCFRKLTIGEKFILKKFRKRWANKNILIIPQLSRTDFDLEPLTDQISEMNDFLYNTSVIKDLSAFFKNLKKSFKMLKINILSFDYIFYSVGQGNKPNKVNRMIKNVNPLRVLTLIDTLQELISNSHFSTINYMSNLGLVQIYYSIPVKLDKNSNMVGGKIILNLFESVLLGIPINRQVLIENFLKTLKIIYFNRQGLNVSLNNPTYRIQTLFTKTIMMNLILRFLERIGSIQINDLKNIKLVTNIMVKNKNLTEIDKYWENKSVYNHPHARALFLLGYLIGEIGYKQYDKGLENDPILKKINFDGMNKRDIIGLYDQVGKMLRNYKIMITNSTILENSLNYYNMDLPEGVKELSESENVFYILSGYSFKKAIVMQKSQENKEKNNIDN